MIGKAEQLEHKVYTEVLRNPRYIS